MTNATWTKLCNEWRANEVNDFAKKKATSLGISMSRINALNSDKMQAVRKYCKANGVWLEDFCESDFYIELMPFGGYDDDSILNLKQVLMTYRKSGKRNSIYKAIMNK